eukprot:scaffold1596_cov176-Alexandrium_tamarense.AAC.1
MQSQKSRVVYATACSREGRSMNYLKLVSNCSELRDTFTNICNLDKYESLSQWRNAAASTSPKKFYPDKTMQLKMTLVDESKRNLPH